MTLRKVQKEEIALLREMSISTFVDAFGDQNTKENMQLYLSEKMSLEQITDEFEHPGSTFYFANIDDKTVGYLKLNTGMAQNEQYGKKSIEVERIYVLKEHQGNKIGQAIFQEVISMAQQLDMEILWLGVWDQNEGAIRFYQRMGLEIFDTHSFMLGTDLQADKLMRIKL